MEVSAVNEILEKMRVTNEEVIHTIVEKYKLPQEEVRLLVTEIYLKNLQNLTVIK